MVVVIAGTSGAGKGTLVARLRELHPELWFSVSVTTRPPRPGEADGIHYHFVDEPEFRRLADGGGLLEWFEVYGQLKGTPRAPVEQHLAAGDDVLLELDVQGALRMKEQYPEALLVFVTVPTREEQRRRLRERGEPVDVVERRLAQDEEYEAQRDRFDHVVVNDDLDRAVKEISGILEARRSAR